MSEDNLKKRIEDWKAQGKKESEITWGMLNDGFQSIAGIPDNFYSAEDPADRARIWEEQQARENEPRSHCGDYCGGCSLCDPEYKD